MSFVAVTGNQIHKYLTGSKQVMEWLIEISLAPTTRNKKVKSR